MASLWHLKQTLAKQLGQAVGNAYVLLLCSQFHILFYAGRPLPNTMALPFVAVAVAQWMRKRTTAAVCMLTFATVRLAVAALQLTAHKPTIRKPLCFQFSLSLDYLAAGRQKLCNMSAKGD